MKKIFFLSAILLLVVGGIYLSQKYVGNGNVSLFKKTSTVTINSRAFKVVVASSQQDKEVGLSKTKSLAPDQGMIFLFDKPDYYPFWMKNMQFPIDIIYTNKDTIVTIKSNAQPPKNNNENLIIYVPAEPSDKVLEIQAGLAEKYKFKNGDKIIYDNLGN